MYDNGRPRALCLPEEGRPIPKPGAFVPKPAAPQLTLTQRHRIRPTSFFSLDQPPHHSRAGLLGQHRRAQHLEVLCYRNAWPARPARREGRSTPRRSACRRLPRPPQGRRYRQPRSPGLTHSTHPSPPRLPRQLHATRRGREGPVGTQCCSPPHHARHTRPPSRWPCVPSPHTQHGQGGAGGRGRGDAALAPPLRCAPVP